VLFNDVMVTRVMIKRCRYRRARKDALTGAARELFLANGYAGASMDAIAAAAHASKGAAYTHYGNKEDLYRAVMRPQAPSPPVALPLEDPIDVVLTRFARRHLENVLDPRHVARLRALALDQHRFPELGACLWASAYERPLTELEGYIRKLAVLGRLCAPAPRTAARHFMGLLLGSCEISVLLGALPPTGMEREQQALDAVSLFLRAYGV
jgi:TetR/AcrR family transcriptional repressor of mexJK operon